MFLVVKMVVYLLQLLRRRLAMMEVMVTLMATTSLPQALHTQTKDSQGKLEDPVQSQTLSRPKRCPKDLNSKPCKRNPL